MATVTFVTADGLPAEWVVPDHVHDIRIKMRSGGGAFPGIGSMGGHYLEVTCRVLPGATIEIFAAGETEPDSSNQKGSDSQVVLSTPPPADDYGYLLLLGGYTYGSFDGDVWGAATADLPDPRNGEPYFYILGETRNILVASEVWYASDPKFYRGGLGSNDGGGGGGASSDSPGADAIGAAGGISAGDGGDGGDAGAAGAFPGGGAGSSEVGDPAPVGAAGSVVIEYFTTHAEDGMAYFGRIQQGSELALALQCTDEYGTPEDPASIPWVQVYLDGATPELITSKAMPSEARRVEDGIFRLSLFLDTLYSTEGRYLVLMKWLDSNGLSHIRTGSFHLLPGGSADGSVIAMHGMIRQDANYMLMQCDSGRLVRKRNPR